MLFILMEQFWTILESLPKRKSQLQFSLSDRLKHIYFKCIYHYKIIFLSICLNLKLVVSCIYLNMSALNLKKAIETQVNPGEVLQEISDDGKIIVTCENTYDSIGSFVQNIKIYELYEETIHEKEIQLNKRIRVFEGIK